MSDAILSPYHVQNEEIFQEYLEPHNGDSILPCGMTKKHPNVAVYLRVSTGDQSVDSQLMKLRPFLMAEGYDVDECSLYIDDGVSAKKNPNFTDRNAGSRMMQDVADGKITVIYGTYVNRFFRRVAEGSAWMDEMAKDFSNVVIKTSDCFASTTTSAGRMMWHTLLMVSEMENEQRAERTQGGMQRLQEQLKKSSHAVYGWFWNEDDGRMNPDWHQQAVIQHVKDSWNDNKGQSFASIARDLNDWNIKTSTGRSWAAGGVTRLVKKPSKMQDQLHQFTPPKTFPVNIRRAFR